MDVQHQPNQAVIIHVDDDKNMTNSLMIGSGEGLPKEEEDDQVHRHIYYNNSSAKGKTVEVDSHVDPNNDVLFQLRISVPVHKHSLQTNLVDIVVHKNDITRDVAQDLVSKNDFSEDILEAIEGYLNKKRKEALDKNSTTKDILPQQQEMQNNQ